MRIIISILGLWLLSIKPAMTQNVKVDSLGFETFEMTEGDTSYVMKKYFMALLKTGPNRYQEPATAAEIQKGHMAHINKMAADGKLCIAGPFGDDSELKGVFILNVPTLADAEALAAEDPAVKAGRLILEIHPWWAAKGSVLE